MARMNDECRAQEFWDNLDYREKCELMDDWYPNHSHLMDLDDMWRGLDLKDRLEIENRDWKRMGG